ncbi:transposase [Streptomyces sp. NPDC059489]|uniref:transposase n=1 Tax=Streptomyces sp. NPDC059489 TaxID=3346849 RepID=UPI0036C4A13E
MSEAVAGSGCPRPADTCGSESEGRTVSAGSATGRPRKSMQPTARTPGVEHQQLQQFMTSSTWSVEAVRLRLARRAVQGAHGRPPESDAGEGVEVVGGELAAPRCARQPRSPTGEQPGPHCLHPFQCDAADPEQQRLRGRTERPAALDGPASEVLHTVLSALLGASSVSALGAPSRKERGVRDRVSL